MDIKEHSQSVQWVKQSHYWYLSDRRKPEPKTKAPEMPVRNSALYHSSNHYKSHWSRNKNLLTTNLLPSLPTFTVDPYATCCGEAKDKFALCTFSWEWATDPTRSTQLLGLACTRAQFFFPLWHSRGWKRCSCTRKVIESFRLEKTLKIIESNCKPNTAKSTTKPCPEVPHLQIF